MNINTYITKVAVSTKWAYQRMANGLAQREAKIAKMSLAGDGAGAKRLVERTNLQLKGGKTRINRVPGQTKKTQRLDATVRAHSVKRDFYGAQLLDPNHTNPAVRRLLPQDYKGVAKMKDLQPDVIKRWPAAQSNENRLRGAIKETRNVRSSSPKGKKEAAKLERRFAYNRSDPSVKRE